MFPPVVVNHPLSVDNTSDFGTSITPIACGVICIGHVRFLAARAYDPLPTVAIAGAVSPATPVHATMMLSAPVAIFLLIFILFPFLFLAEECSTFSAI